MTSASGHLVNSSIGKATTDSSGSPVAVVRMDAANAYVGIPPLLQRFINESNVEAWAEIRRKIDYTYENLDHALARLDEETGFAEKVKSEVKAGKKLLFKPNMVLPVVIDPETHGAGPGAMAVSNWTVTAALMRWFHDIPGISYHCMSIGEASTTMTATAVTRTKSLGGDAKVTTEAIMEGKYGEHYGGWGFYFARLYLSESHDASHTDDPMRGHHESVSGEYIPPGRADGRLMVYDLNRINDDPSKGRDVPISDGANYKELTLHKVIVGGDPDNPQDMMDYPGCVLINVPRLRLHGMDLFTNALKNLGIGLIPMEVTSDGNPDSTLWKYAVPARPSPGMKARLPHSVWMVKLDEETGLPVRDSEGKYVVTRTAGMKGTQADTVKATKEQGVFMVHVSDGIELLDMTVGPVPEGYVFASLDPVALDLTCARYMFKTIPLEKAREFQKRDNLPVDFLQSAPVPHLDGNCIVTGDGIEAPVSRYVMPAYAAGRGLGQLDYHVVGWDSVTETPLASLQGHLGRIEDETFVELITSQLYYSPLTPLWYLQHTLMAYLESNDTLTGSSYRQQLLDAFDENGDGQLDFDEMGKNGFWTYFITLGGIATHLGAAEEYGFLRGQFMNSASFLRHSRENWNSEGHDIFRAFHLASVLGVAFGMSRAPQEGQDPLFPGMTWGKGNWPSFQFAERLSVLARIYGQSPTGTPVLMSIYGAAFQYADKKLNDGGYTGSTVRQSKPSAIQDYVDAVSRGVQSLDFVLYVPSGYGPPGGRSVPNIVETEDPAKVLTAHFESSREIW